MPRYEEEENNEHICRQCPVPTKPSQCPHTSDGRAYLKQQRSLQQQAAAQYWSAMYSSSPQQIGDSSPLSWTSPTPVYTVSLSNRSSFPSSGRIDPLLLAGREDGSAPIAQSSIPLPNVMPDGNLSNPTSENRQLLSSPAGDDAQSASDDDTLSVAANRRSRVRVTKTNPIHGYIVGAMRGGKRYNIIRTKPLRDPIASQAEASARFLRCATDIIERCERMSNETGCWLYFTTQHLFARAPFLHYASPRLLKEGKKDTEQLTNHFNKLFASLVASRNEESKQLHQRLLSAEDEKRTATEALAAAQGAERDALLRAESTERRLQLQAEELEANRLQVEALRAQLRVAHKKSRAE
ncbi:hypothetical protein R3P38DRAFT_3203172 [Favolaschia claudopus]|uniref:Uncharacterized protein n=1 Tax=Favolaschia claudopus TaxID=2862362 RepID=A0AAW0ASX1_9AGAR